LGDAAGVDSCEIVWPSGTVQKLGSVRVDALNEVVEPPLVR
jgi:hypothetical protein